MIANVVLASALLIQPADSTREIQAHRLTAAAGRPTLDGVLDEPIWEQAEVATGFVQFQPDPGAAASQRTEARVLYTEDALYVAMRLYDTAPDSIAAQLARRDEGDIYSDWAHVGIDSYNDNRTAFRFSVTPRGVKADGFHFDDSNEDSGWDAVWDVATQVDSLGWTAEFRIPLSQLRFSARTGAEQVWGIQFAREIARREEMSFWAPVPPNSGRIVSSFGELRGLRDLDAGDRLELQPYTVAKVTRAPGDPDDPFYDATDPVAAFGADLKYGVTSNLTLTATLNPDFGQVEADPSEVNLSAFESFFGERRPFFTEGSDIFEFPLMPGNNDNQVLFYSRRIGRAPQGGLPGDAAFADAPESTTILGAAKLSGKTSDGWSIGLLNAVTAEEQARVETAEGTRRDVAVEPLTNYTVARVRRDFREGESALGGILTMTQRRLEEDELGFLRSAAYAGGFDLRHRFAGGRYEVLATLLGSRIEGSPEAIAIAQRSSARYFQRPDADHVTYDPERTSLTGTAASLLVGKVDGGHWGGGMGAAFRSPGFEVNDLGFQREADQIVAGGFLGYQEFRPGPVFRRWNLGINPYAVWNFGGDRIGTAASVNGGFQLRSFWGAHAGIRREFEALSPTALRGGPMIATPARTNAWFGMYTDNRKPVRFFLGGGFSNESETEGRSWRIGPEMELRASTRMELSLEPSYNWNLSAWQFIGSQSLTDERRYLFGRMEQRTAAITARLSYTFTPNLSLQFYGQPFVSAGSFSDFRYVADPRAGRFDDRLPRFAGSLDELERDENGRFLADLDDDGAADLRFGNPDFNFKSFRSNAVLRWEYRPGSTLFVVWSQGRQHSLRDGSFDLGRDFGRLFGADDEYPVPATNILLVKLNYWLNF